MGNTCAFVESSRKIAEKFLQTVVVVDDKAFLSSEDRPHGDLRSPGRGTKMDIEDKPELADRTPAIDSHELNAKELVDRFAEKGLVCAVIRAEDGSESLSPETVAVSKRADIVVLDWVIGNERGTKTLELIKGITGDDVDQSSTGRVRLIAIYTGENDLLKIIDVVEKDLKESYSVTRINDFTLTWGASRIAVYAKEDVSVPDQLKNRVIPISKLPNTLINEFSEMTMGLLSNFALASFTAIRDNTHRVLAKFPSYLDAPYLAHRSLIDPPEEAESHVLPLFVSEIESVLNDTKVADQVSLPTIEHWFNCSDMSPVDLHRRMKFRSKKTAHDAMMDLVKRGIRKETASSSCHSWKKVLHRFKSEADKECLSDLTAILTMDGRPGEQSDRELALLMSVNTRYSSPPPALTLGTIVAEDIGERTSYFVCIQPRCDSVRLTAKRYFPFLKFTVASNSDAKDFGYIIRDKKQTVELRLKIRPHEAQQILFKPKSQEKEILAVKGGSDWVFSSKGSGGGARQFRWVADLKPAHAQRIANEFAHEISRVGLTESEWLRRKAK